MPTTKKSTILKRIGKLSEKNADPIKLAVALAQLDAVAHSELDMKELMDATEKSSRTISYLRSIGRRLVELGLHERTFVSLGWTKSIEIARLCSKETLQDALDYAESHTVIELRRYLTGEKEVKPTRAVNLRLSDKQYALFRKVLLAHGAVPAGKGLRHQEVALTKALKTVATPAAKKS